MFKYSLSYIIPFSALAASECFETNEHLSQLNENAFSSAILLLFLVHIIAYLLIARENFADSVERLMIYVQGRKLSAAR